jgi:osmotically-inducible protein OsmY
VAIALATLAITGCRSTDSQYGRSAGQYIDDKALAGDVTDALENDPVYKLGEVTVNAYRGTVQLAGFVSTQEQKDSAAEIAGRVAGVHEVENNISLKPEPLRRDLESERDGSIDADGRRTQR